jgi:hypothetical protein
MEELMRHPITTIFHNPIDPAKAPEGYFTRIRNPRDLKDICHLLSASKYASLSDWADDVELVWRNSEDFHGNRSPITAAAQYSRKLFLRLRSQLEERTVKVWCADLNRLRTRESALVAKCPVRIRGVASELAEFKPFQHREAVQYFSDKEVNSFLEASKMITAEVNLRQMLKIIKEIQPRLNVGEDSPGPLWLDVTILSVQTFLALQDYMRGVLEEQGSKYPE